MSPPAHQYGLGAIDRIDPGVIGLYFVVAMVIHRHIGTHPQSSEKGVWWPKLLELGLTGATTD